MLARDTTPRNDLTTLPVQRAATPSATRTSAATTPANALPAWRAAHAESGIHVSARLGNYLLSLARSESDLRDAQRLRYKVFAEECGAHLVSSLPGHDIDYFDDFCDHLIVRDQDNGRLAGTYRILPPHAAHGVGRYYSEGEFCLDRLAPLRSGLVEVGRSCIHRDYRSGAVISMLWSGLASYMAQGNYSHLIGCASISMADGGHNAANLYATLPGSALAPAEYHVQALNPLPVAALLSAQPAVIPPLIKGYLRAGAWVCGEPAWDAHFNSADLLVLLPMSQLKARYARHFGAGV